MTPHRRVLSLFEDIADLPADQAWAVAADAIESCDPAFAQVKVGGIVHVLPTTPSRSRRPDLRRAGLDPDTWLADLSDDERRELGEALRQGRALRSAVSS